MHQDQAQSCMCASMAMITINFGTFLNQLQILLIYFVFFLLSIPCIYNSKQSKIQLSVQEKSSNVMQNIQLKGLNYAHLHGLSSAQLTMNAYPRVTSIDHWGSNGPLAACGQLQFRHRCATRFHNHVEDFTVCSRLAIIAPVQHTTVSFILMASSHRHLQPPPDILG